MKHRKLLVVLPLALLVAACNRDPRKQAESSVEKGNDLFNKGKFKDASIMYRRAIQKDARYGEAYYRAGLTDLKLSALAEAVKDLQRAVELQPQNVDAATKLADLYLLASAQIRDPKRTEQIMKDAEEIGTRLSMQAASAYEGHRILGQLALIRNDPGKAVTEFDAATKIKPDQPDVALAYFQALLGSNRAPEAEALARRVIEKNKNYGPMYDILYVQLARSNKIPEAEEVLKEKTANNPKNSTYQLQLAGHFVLSNQRPKMDEVMAKLSNETDFPDGHLLAGDFYFFRLAELDNAQKQYEAAIRAFPKDKALYQKRLVELFAAKGNTAEANNIVAELIRNDPKDTDAQAMKAALQLATGDKNQIAMAVTDLQGLVTKSPDNHLLRYNLGRALLAKGDSEQGKLQLQEAIKLRSDLIPARQLLSRVWIGQGDYNQALKGANEIIALDANNLQSHLIRSSALIGLQQNDQARQELDWIAKTYPQNLDSRYQAGYLAWATKDYKKSEMIFRDLAKQNPKDARGSVGLAETLVSQNRLPEATQVMEAASQADPKNTDLQVSVANMYARASKYDEAIRRFKAVESVKGTPDIYYRLGEAYRLKGDAGNAMAYFQKAGSATPPEPNSLLRLSMMYEEKGDRGQAKPLYEKLLLVQPDNAIALNNLAVIKAEEGTDLDSALTMAQKAKSALPKSPDVTDTLAFVYLKKNLTDDAVRMFTQLVQDNPNSALAHLHYGMALAQKGDKGGARRELELASRSKPKADEAAKIRDALAKL